jgi:hypothetical protein
MYHVPPKDHRRRQLAHTALAMDGHTAKGSQALPHDCWGKNIIQPTKRTIRHILWSGFLLLESDGLKKVRVPFCPFCLFLDPLCGSETLISVTIIQFLHLAKIEHNSRRDSSKNSWTAAIEHQRELSSPKKQSHFILS